MISVFVCYQKIFDNFFSMGLFRTVYPAIEWNHEKELPANFAVATINNLVLAFSPEYSLIDDSFTLDAWQRLAEQRKDLSSTKLAPLLRLAAEEGHCQLFLFSSTFCTVDFTECEGVVATLSFLVDADGKLYAADKDGGH